MDQPTQELHLGWFLAAGGDCSFHEAPAASTATNRRLKLLDRANRSSARRHVRLDERESVGFRSKRQSPLRPR
jgi:hypothetical protein